VKKFGLMGAPGIAPSPVNLFMNVKVRGDGGLGFERPSVGKGEEVGFRAEADLVVVLSACPMDFRASEEWVPEPVGVEYHILEGE